MCDCVQIIPEKRYSHWKINKGEIKKGLQKEMIQPRVLRYLEWVENRRGEQLKSININSEESKKKRNN